MDVAHAENTTAFKRINAAKVKFLALKRAHPGLDPIVPTRMASATEEGTRQRRLQALGHLNAALEDFDGSRSQDAINLDTVQEQIRATNVAYGQFVGWHNKFLDFRWEEAAMDAAHAESTAAFKKINTAKAQFLALKRANSGIEPSAPRAKIPSRMVEVHATAVDPDGDTDAPNPGSASGQADARDGDRENGRAGRAYRRGNGRGGGTCWRSRPTTGRKLQVLYLPPRPGFIPRLCRNGRHRKVGIRQGKSSPRPLLLEGLPHARQFYASSLLQMPRYTQSLLTLLDHAPRQLGRQFSADCRLQCRCPAAEPIP